MPRCPHCNQENWRSLEIVVTEGTSTETATTHSTSRYSGYASGAFQDSNGVHHSVGMPTSGTVRESSTTTTVQKSALAQKYSPPEQKSWLGSLILQVVLLPFLYVLLFTLMFEYPKVAVGLALLMGFGMLSDGKESIKVGFLVTAFLAGIPLIVMYFLPDKTPLRVGLEWITMGVFWIFWIFGMVHAVTEAMAIKKYNQHKFFEDLNAWKRSALCLGCGKIFYYK